MSQIRPVSRVFCTKISKHDRKLNFGTHASNGLYVITDSKEKFLQSDVPFKIVFLNGGKK